MLVLVGDATHAELADNFIRTTPKILKFLAKRRGPMIAKVYRPSPAGPAAGPAVAGRIELWYPKQRRP